MDSKTIVNSYSWEGEQGTYITVGRGTYKPVIGPCLVQNAPKLVSGLVPNGPLQQLS